jgi:hypothetical protein
MPSLPCAHSWPITREARFRDARNRASFEGRKMALQRRHFENVSVQQMWTWGRGSRELSTFHRTAHVKQILLDTRVANNTKEALTIARLILERERGVEDRAKIVLTMVKWFCVDTTVARCGCSSQ